MCIPLHPTQSLHDSFQPSPHTSPSNPVPTPLLLTLSLHFSSGHRHYSTLMCVYTTPPNPVPTRLLPTQSLHLSFQPSPYTAPTNPVPILLLRAPSLQHSPNPLPTPLLPTQSLRHLPCKWFNLEIRLSHYLYFFSAIHFPGACELSFFVALENRLCGLKG